ncbi:triacylglycerol lipase [Rhodococcus triatomae]|uniref:Triacylglycerol lipase n=2 Tax=Rhodococcus triatomae TaxID=300028 RepID=A0A1G8PQD0_9NOCA|nr:triacylglycerol lipase [Rhodococcus triatomae]
MWAAAAAAALGIQIMLGGTAAAEPDPVPIAPAQVVPTPPEFDGAFYDPRSDVVAAAQPGQILAARQVNLAHFSLVPLNADAWQVSFRSTNTRGEPIAAVTTLMKPRGGTADAGRHLLSVQVAEDSLARYCAPSYALQQFSAPSPLTGQVVVPLEFLLHAAAALHQGWAVAIPDYQGPNSAYAAGPLHARIVLDGIRAAENFEPLQLSGADTRVGLMGYSGGAIATGHAAELHDSYAPELNIVGAAEGGIPADLGALVNLANNNLGAGMILGGVIGVSRESTELAEFLDRTLTPEARLLVAAKDPLCVSYQSALLPFSNMKGMIATAGDPLDDPVVREVLDDMAMGKHTPRTPMFMYQSNPDWLIPVGPVNDLVDTYCQDPNARVQYTRDHASEHLSLEPIAAPAAMMWMRDRMNGIPVEPGCSVTDVPSMALDDATIPVWTEIVGETLAALFGKATGA